MIILVIRMIRSTLALALARIQVARVMVYRMTMVLTRRRKKRRIIVLMSLRRALESAQKRSQKIARALVHVITDEVPCKVNRQRWLVNRTLGANTT